jgi:hypothetical protein
MGLSQIEAEQRMELYEQGLSYKDILLYLMLLNTPTGWRLSGRVGIIVAIYAKNNLVSVKRLA